MTKLPLILMATAAAAIAFTIPASAGPCAEREAITKKLAESYHETRQAIGLAGEAQVVEVYSSASGTWTLLVTDTKGRTCVIAAGEAWQDAPKVLAGLDL